MQQRTQVSRWERFWFGLISTISVLLLTTVLEVVGDFYRLGDLHWFNGGEEQVVGFVLFVGGAVALATYVLLVVPLILFWSPKSQLKHWYALVCVSLLCPLVMECVILDRRSPAQTFQEIRQALIFYGREELFAFCACVGYLLLIRREQHKINALHRD